MIIRPAKAADAAAVVAVWNPIIQNSAATFNSVPKPPQDVAQDIVRKHNEGKAFLVAERDGTLLGFATYGQFRGGVGYAYAMEHTVILAPEAQGQGTGRGLMQALEAHARAAGVHVMMGGISAENPGAVAFHKAIGYREMARLPEVGFKFGRWMDLVLMQKML